MHGQDVTHNLVEINRFEFRVFHLQDWLIQQG